MIAAARDVLEALSSMGVTIEARGGRGGRLHYRPRSAITPDILEAVKICKPELLQILQNRSPSPNGSGNSGSCRAASSARAGLSPGSGVDLPCAVGARTSPIETLTQTPADGDSYADREWARFLSVAVQTRNGWRDPAEPVLQRGVKGEEWNVFVRDCGCLGRGGAKRG